MLSQYLLKNLLDLYNMNAMINLKISIKWGMLQRRTVQRWTEQRWTVQRETVQWQILLGVDATAGESHDYIVMLIT